MCSTVGPTSVWYRNCWGTARSRPRRSTHWSRWSIYGRCTRSVTQGPIVSGTVEPVPTRRRAHTARGDVYPSPTNRSRTPTGVDIRVQAGKGCGISQDRVEVRRVVVLESPHEGTLLSTYRVCRRRPGWGTTSLVSAGPWGGQGL